VIDQTPMCVQNTRNCQGTNRRDASRTRDKVIEINIRVFVDVMEPLSVEKAKKPAWTGVKFLRWWNGIDW